MIDRELYMEQLQSILVLAAFFLCLWLGHWLYHSLGSEKWPVHMLRNTDNRIVNHYTLLYFEPVDVNSATLEELDLLPGVGPKTAQAILNLRQENGFFLLNEELKDALTRAHLPRRYMNLLAGSYLTAESFK